MLLRLYYRLIDIQQQMGRLIELSFALLLLTLTAAQDDGDLVDLKKITKFPKDYQGDIYAGYLDLVSFNQAFYYILVQSLQNVDNNPLILWLGGGPGCSSLISFFYQNGPFYFKDKYPATMEVNPYNWNKKASVLYLESPGGVGFSQATKQYLISNDTSSADDNMKALHIFFDKYKHFRGNDFYIAGQDYAGVFITRLAQLILDYNEQQQQKISFKGILLGNACTHPYECSTAKYYSRFTTEYLYSRGFLEEAQYSQYKSTCLTNEGSTNCINAQKAIFDYFSSTKANIFNIYAECPKVSGLQKGMNCTDLSGAASILNTKQFREALNVRDNLDSLLWSPCSDSLLYTKETRAAYTILPTLVNAGIRLFYYSGDIDALVPITGTLYWFDKYRSDYGAAIKKSWRPWVTTKQNISGMVWQMDSMTFASVKGAGHMAGLDHSAQVEEIFNIFMGNKVWTYPDYYLQSAYI